MGIPALINIVLKKAREKMKSAGLDSLKSWK